MDTDWFSVTTGGDLEQGDLLKSLAIYRVEVDEAEEAVVLRERHDVVILTQTCDLTNDKVDDVLLGRVVSYDFLARTEGDYIRATAWRRAAVEGNLPAYFLLPIRDTEPDLAWSVVDFHNVFSVPKALTVAAATACGPRLRLVPPYKEHLAQAFARFIMRVGLPTPLDEFKTYKPA